MKILFIHQNFPGQFVHLAPALAARGHDVMALSLHANPPLPGVRQLHYQVTRGNHPQQHPWLVSFETQTIRAEACALRMHELKQQGWSPDCVVAHAGWGDALFVKDIFPASRLVCFLEYAYQTRQSDIDFDPEFLEPGWQSQAPVGLKNATNHLMLAQMDAAYTPTHWQKQTQPKAYHDAISVIHDGINTQALQPRSDASMQFKLADTELLLRRGDKVITFVNRNLEPYRGYHQFMRALPAIQRAHADATIIIVGGDKHSYGAAAPAGKSWKQIYLDEMQDQIDTRRIIFTGQISYPAYLSLLAISACHVYLTYPFVLSWSMLEAMSMGCVVVGSATAPVQEVIDDGKNGLLVDFFEPHQIAGTINRVLSHPQEFVALRQAARAHIQEFYDLHKVCLPKQLALIEHT